MTGERLRLWLERGGSGYYLPDAASGEPVRWEDPRLRVVGDARDTDDPEPRVFPANGLAAGRVRQVVTGPAALEPEPEALARHTLRVLASRSRDRTVIKR